MAVDGVLHHLLEIFEGVRLCEDGMAQGPGSVAAFRRFVHKKNDLSVDGLGLPPLLHA
jgi:hypothetical protein